MTPDELTARKLAALAHPARLAVIRMLVRTGPAGSAAGKLGEALDIPANALTFHLQKLAQFGLVTSQRQGQFNVYSAVFSELFNLVDNLVGACCANASEKCDPKCPSEESGIDDIESTTDDGDHINHKTWSLE